jgi:alkylhydroperoxidase family enzyme
MQTLTIHIEDDAAAAEVAARLANIPGVHILPDDDEPYDIERSILESQNAPPLTPAQIAALDKAIESVKAGKVYDLEDVIAELDKELDELEARTVA